MAQCSALTRGRSSDRRRLFLMNTAGHMVSILGKSAMHASNLSKCVDFDVVQKLGPATYVEVDSSTYGLWSFSYSEINVPIIGWEIHDYGEVSPYIISKRRVIITCWFFGNVGGSKDKVYCCISLNGENRLRLTSCVTCFYMY